MHCTRLAAKSRRGRISGAADRQQLARLVRHIDVDDTALIVTATVRRSGRLVGVVDVDVANEAGQLLAIGRATYATAE